MTVTPGQRDPVHLMTIEMGAWCGATGPRCNGRASSAWREVTCAECHDRRAAWFLALTWDMLQAMPASHAALAFAVRAERLGVTDEHGRPLAMACATDVGAAQQPAPDSRRALLDIIAAVEQLDEPGPEADHIRLLAEYGLGEAAHPDEPADNSILLSGPRSEGVAAPELAAALAEPRELRKVITELLSMFKGISGGYGARTSSSRLRKIAARAGVHWDSLTLPAPDTTEAAETQRLHELLDEIGVMAANAPEEGDSFGVLEQIAMRIATADVPS